MLAGALIEMVFIRWLRRPSVLRLIIITIGLSIAIRELALLLWGEGVRALPISTGTAVTSFSVGDVHISPQVLWVLGISAVMVAALNFFFSRTLLGRQMRACACNREAAQLCGISAKNMVTLSFVLSAGIGALAGCVISPITYVQYDSGTSLAIKGFTVGHPGAAWATAWRHRCRTSARYPGIVLYLGHARCLQGVIAITSSCSFYSCGPSGLFAMPRPHASRNTDARRRNLPLLVMALAVIAGARAGRGCGNRSTVTQLTMAGYYSLVIVGLTLLMGYTARSRWARGFFAIGGYTSGCSPRTTCTREAAKLSFHCCGRPVFSSRARICTVAIFWWLRRGGLPDRAAASHLYTMVQNHVAMAR